MEMQGPDARGNSRFVRGEINRIEKRDGKKGPVKAVEIGKNRGPAVKGPNEGRRLPDIHGPRNAKLFKDVGRDICNIGKEVVDICTDRSKDIEERYEELEAVLNGNPIMKELLRTQMNVSVEDFELLLKQAQTVLDKKEEARGIGGAERGPRYTTWGLMKGMLGGLKPRMGEGIIKGTAKNVLRVLTLALLLVIALASGLTSAAIGMVFLTGFVLISPVAVGAFILATGGVLGGVVLNRYVHTKKTHNLQEVQKRILNAGVQLQELGEEMAVIFKNDALDSKGKFAALEKLVSTGSYKVEENRKLVTRKNPLMAHVLAIRMNRGIAETKNQFTAGKVREFLKNAKKLQFLSPKSIKMLGFFDRFINFREGSLGKRVLKGLFLAIVAVITAPLTVPLAALFLVNMLTMPLLLANPIIAGYVACEFVMWAKAKVGGKKGTKVEEDELEKLIDEMEAIAKKDLGKANEIKWVDRKPASDDLDNLFEELKNI